MAKNQPISRLTFSLTSRENLYLQGKLVFHEESHEKPQRGGRIPMPRVQRDFQNVEAFQKTHTKPPPRTHQSNETKR